jgi:hypothetical protein
METGHLAFVAPEFRQRFFAAAPEQFEADATTMLDPVGQRQVVACGQAQALGGGAHHRRQQGFQLALPGRMHLLQGAPRRRVKIDQGHAELGKARTTTAFHDHHRRTQRLFAVAQQAPGRTVGHAAARAADAQRAAFGQSAQQLQQARGIDIPQQGPEIPVPAQSGQVSD